MKHSGRYYGVWLTRILLAGWLAAVVFCVFWYS